MKKIYGLMLVPVLALSGCVSKITNEEGVKRAQEIAEHKIDTSEIKALKMESKNFIEADVTQDGVRNYFKLDIHTVTEFSKDKSFAHTLMKMSSSSIEGKDKSESQTEVEFWAYVKDEKFVAATRSVLSGKETKIYSEVESGAAAAFKVALEGVLGDSLEELQGLEYLPSVQAMLSLSEKEQKEEGMVYKVTAYSGGEGSLVVKGKVDITEYEGFKGKGSGSIKYAWDNYMIKQVKVSMKAEANDTEKKATGKVAIDSVDNVKFKCRPSYPNLKDYKKGVL